jgi:hypothetical protein
MNAASDLSALGPGALSIMVEIADDRVCSVRVVSSRPTHLTRLFIGRPAKEIPILAERLSRGGKIDDYAIVAPTEWNFHPAGRFVAAVRGARVSKATAAASISWLAGLFGPCVPFRVEVMEPAHA